MYKYQTAATNLVEKLADVFAVVVVVVL